MLRSPSPVYVNGLPVQPLTPRAWAAAIVQLPTLDERRAAMELVPEHWRDLVRTHLINAWHHPQRNKETS
ncbi:MAG TPA: hypothetical protein DEP32_13800 [Pseudomonas sp.]|nr:hypothetical protein [Pseudomonas sp.]MBB50279.1 hypothetical protein [Pseudomonadales bacterium]MBB50473.1 hypothetical protein [Pseudomonadales bacterium]HCA25234.1 hypothetical protein [Pseudomonas sp.]|tara:strand:- start:5936 stop:6145 length:210 start_codon:yes stop_codon:yes gene_type:complete